MNEPAASPSRNGIVMAWLLGSALVFVFLTRDILLTDGGIIDRSVVWARDFVNVWTGGRLVLAGAFDTLYDPRTYAAFQRSLFGAIDPHNYSYPPLSYPLAAALSFLPYPVALAIWQIASVAFFAWAARPWWPLTRRWWWLAALTPAALVNIWAGHYGFIVGGLYLLDWRALDEHPLRAGVYFGLMLIKPHLALLVPLALLLLGDWRAIAAAARLAIIVGTTTLIYGWTPWQAYLFQTLGYQAGMIDAGGKFFGLLSTSMLTAVDAAGWPWALALALQLASAVLGLALVAVAIRRKASTPELALLVATATFLVLPYAFAYDLTVVAIAALTLLARPLPRLDERLALFGFVAPQVGIAAAIVSLPLMPFMLAGQAIAQFRAIGRAVPAGADAAH